MCAMCEGLVELCNDAKTEGIAENVYSVMEQWHVPLEKALETVKPEKRDEVREKIQAMQKGG